MRRLTTMNDQGELTIPASTRRKLKLRGQVTFLVTVVGETVVLTPIADVPAEDRWAYPPDHRQQVVQSGAEIQTGLVMKHLPAIE